MFDYVRDDICDYGLIEGEEEDAREDGGDW